MHFFKQSGAMSRRHVFFLASVGLVALALYRPLSVVLRSALTNDAHASILMVMPLTVALLWKDQKKIFSVAQYSRVAIFGLVTLLVLSAAFGISPRQMDQEVWLTLCMLLFAACLIAAFVSCYGTTAFILARFPLLLLILIVPLPEVVHQQIVGWLQYASADATSWLFQIAHVPFSRSGVVLALPRVTIEIAQECSGIRSSMVLLITTLVLAHLFLKSTWSRGLLLILLVPVTIAKNGLRIFVLSMLGMYVDPSFLTGRLHHNGGVVFFALAFLCMWGIATLLRRFEDRGTPSLPLIGNGSGPVLIAKNLL